MDLALLINRNFFENLALATGKPSRLFSDSKIRAQAEAGPIMKALLGRHVEEEEIVSLLTEFV